MGSYRFLLAVLVALSHGGVSFGGKNPGVAAVISFYLLSGYVMTLLVEKYYLSMRLIPAFYIDRLSRIYPQFLFYIFLTTICIFALGLKSAHFEGLSLSNWLAGLLMLPQGYYMFWEREALVVPQAWSLGLELTFYLLFPWLLIYCSPRSIVLISALSLCVFVVACAGILNTDHYGYRLLPGTLFMFLAGHCLAHFRRYSVYLISLYLSIGGICIWLFLNPEIKALNYNREVMLGLLVGIPAVALVRSLRITKWDSILGDLSYGVFLNHFLIIWLLDRFAPGRHLGLLEWTAILLCSVALSYLSLTFIESPAIKWRRAIRTRALNNTDIPVLRAERA